MKHRIARAAAVTAVAALALTACSAPAADTDAGGDDAALKGEVTLWMYPVIRDEAASKDFWETAEADYEKEFPDVDLTIELQTFDKRDEQISAALAANSGPDIVLITPDQAATYLNVGGLLPVDDAIEDERDAFFPATLEAATFEDELYGVPLFQNVFTTAYNKTVFDEAGLELPTTWDEIREAAPVLADSGIAVMDYLGTPEQTLNLSFYPFLWQAGGTVFSDDGTEIAFDSKEGVEALEFLVELQKEGGLPADAATQSVGIEGSPLAAGTVGIRPTTQPSELAQMRAALGEENVVVGPPLEGETQATYGNPGLLSLTSINKSENRAAASSVLAFLTSKDFQTELNAAAGNFPSRTDVEIAGPEADRAAYEAALKVANPGEPNPAARQVMAVLAPYIQSALRGDLSAKDALEKAAEEAQAVLDRS
ncbi:extracellular solute-binding protein [Microbacterium sp. LWH11-1.2]|uniref:extracellular solute-binding protein n=1 Tax=Microbacterium sp. LWH11-1.2 TaxID=3135258 RepID=UPI0031391FD5